MSKMNLLTVLYALLVVIGAVEVLYRQEVPRRIIGAVLVVLGLVGLSVLRL